MLQEFEYFTQYRNDILCIPFTSVTDYIDKLQNISIALGKLGNQSLFYLAAAVSDFYIPEDMMIEHKIQSSTGLTLELEQVPKMLKSLVTEWASNSFVISFKLETDINMLFPKARQAISGYGVDLVIANLLQVLICVINIFIYSIIKLQS